MCVRSTLITTGQSATNLLAGVAEPTKNTSRLIADVWGEAKMDMAKTFGSPRSLYAMITKTDWGYDAEV